MNLLLLPWWTPGPSMPFRRSPVRARRHKEVVLICAFNPCTFLPFPRTHTPPQTSKTKSRCKQFKSSQQLYPVLSKQIYDLCCMFFPKVWKASRRGAQKPVDQFFPSLLHKIQNSCGRFWSWDKFAEHWLFFFLSQAYFFYYSPFRNYLSVFSAMYTK